MSTTLPAYKYGNYVATRSVEERVVFVNGSLDKLEGVQNQFAAGCILIGMELLALKSELGHGNFKETFASKIERPRFAYRTAARFMKIAEVLRVKLAAGSSVRLGEVLAMALAPSAMADKDRDELLKRLSDAVQGKTMQQLMLDFAPQRPQLPAGDQPDEPGEHERKTAAWYRMHYNEALTDLIAKMAKVVTAPRFRGALHDEDLKQHRTHLEALLQHFKPTAKKG